MPACGNSTSYILKITLLADSAAYAVCWRKAQRSFVLCRRQIPNHSLATKFEREAQEMIVRQRAGLVH